MKENNSNLTPKQVCLLLALSNEDFVELEVKQSNSDSWHNEHIHVVDTEHKLYGITDQDGNEVWFHFARLPEGQEMPVTIEEVKDIISFACDSITVADIVKSEPITELENNQIIKQKLQEVIDFL